MLEVDGQIMGYILGSRFPEKQSAFDQGQMASRLKRVLKGYFGSFNSATRRYIHWLIWRGWREVPETPQGMAHFHINLLPGFKNVRQTKEMIDFFLNHLAKQGEKAVYGQMVTFAGRRGERMFARYGFEVIDSKEVTNFRAYTNDDVYLFTVVKDLQANTGLYGNDLWKSKS